MEISRKAYFYIGIVFASSMLLTTYVFTSEDFSFPLRFDFSSESSSILFVLIFWSLLGIISESLTVVLPNGMGISVALAIYLASTIIGGPRLAIIVAASSYIFSVVKSGDKYSHILNTPYFKVVFNISLFILSAGIPGLVFSFLTNHQYGNFFFIPTIITVCVYFMVNSVVMSELVAIVSRKGFLTTWIGTCKVIVFNVFAVGMIGIILALAYISYGPAAVILFFAPLLLARYSFKLYLNMKHTYIETIAAFNKFLEAKDMYTSGHANRVLKYSELMGEAISLREDRMENLKNAAILHDIGKIGIDDSILKKPAALSNEEYMTIKDHVKIGAEIIDGIDFLKGISKIVAQHHERPDGKGYPNGLTADEICMEASILAIADVYDAMISDRPYRKGLPVDVAISELRKNAGTQFNPDLTEVFIDILEKERRELEEQQAISDQMAEAGDKVFFAIGDQNPVK